MSDDLDNIDVSISMPDHIGDWKRETDLLSLSERAAHHDLRHAAWTRGGYLPLEHSRLARLVGVSPAEWPPIWEGIGPLWSTTDDGRIYQARMLVDLERSRTAKRSAIARGHESARQRKEKKANSQQSGNGLKTVSKQSGDGHEDPTPTPTPTPSPDPTPSPPPNTPQSPPRGAGQLVLVSPAETAEGEPAQVRAVFAHYQKHHPRAFPEPQSTSKEWRLIRDRLREGHTVATLCEAIDGYHESAYHLGANATGAKYLHLTLIVRDGDHVAAGLRYHEARGQAVMSERERRGAIAGATWASRMDAREVPRG